jgi:acyl-CoA synthetase (AMP-forming)/AMP-acid ligase II
LPHGTRSDRLATAIADCTPRVCVTDSKTAADADAALAAARVRVLIVDGAGAALRSSWTAVEPDALELPDGHLNVHTTETDLAAIIYTSGSTGAPRGVMLTHLNIRANTQSIVAYLRLQETDRVIVVLPFHYVYGLSLLHTHVAVGGAVVIENRSAFPNVTLRTMRQQEVTGLAGVPSTFALLLHRSSIASASLPALRYVTQAGGPMPPAMIREWRRVLPHVPFFVMYGATEASARLSYLEPGQLERRLGSIGRAIPNVELRLLNQHNVEVGAGEVGEIVARGSNISTGYWNAPEETRQVFGPEGYHTGDLARADEDGYLYIVGRTRDMLKVGAHRVGAREIEDVLHEHEHVHEAAVVGTPHDLLGETPVAFVSLRQRHLVAEDAIRGFCASRLADYKVPERVVILDDLPKSAAGKIDKRALRALLDTPATIGDR